MEQLKAQAKQDGATVQENGLLAAVFAQEVASAVCHPRRLGKHSFSRTRGGLLLALGVLAIGLLAQTAQGGVTFTNLVSFTGTNGDSPIGTLVQGRDGNLYGVTQGGTFGPGPVFKMALNGTLAILASFGGTNGWGPHAGLVRGADGNLYGTSDGGGPYWCGTVYRVTAGGVLTTLASFNGTNGATPRGMTQATDGNFYGMTGFGGVGYLSPDSYSGSGTVFQVTPTGAVTSLVLFTNGELPFGGLMQASDGNLYGMTRHGGAYGHGNIFRLSVPMPPILRTMTQTGGTVGLAWSAVAGQKYQVQHSTTLGQTNWFNLGSPFTATDGTATASDTNGPDPQRLYRVVLLP